MKTQKLTAENLKPTEIVYYINEDMDLKQTCQDQKFYFAKYQNGWMETEEKSKNYSTLEEALTAFNTDSIESESSPWTMPEEKINPPVEANRISFGMNSNYCQGCLSKSNPEKANYQMQYCENCTPEKTARPRIESRIERN